MKYTYIFIFLSFISIILFMFSCDVLTKMNESEWNEKNLDEVKEDIFFIYVAGYCFNGILTNDDFFTIKFQEDGKVCWERRRNNSNNDQAFGIALDNSGYVYVGGMTDNTGAGSPSDYFLIKYNIKGDEIWIRPDNYSITSWESITDISCNNNNIYVTGYYFDPNIGAMEDDFCTVNYDSNSNVLWNVDFQIGPEVIADRGYGIQYYNNNIYVVGGSIQPGDPNSDICLIRYDTSGTILNTVYYPDINDLFSEVAKDIIIDKNGNIYIIGYRDLLGGNFNYILLKYDSSLNLQWEKIIDINTDDRGEGVDVDSAGNVYIALHSGSGLGNFDCYTIKFDQLGNETWRRQYGTSGVDDQLWDVAVDPKGNVYVVGNSNNNFLIIKYGFYGDQRWVRNFDIGGSNDQARSVVIGKK